MTEILREIDSIVRPVVEDFGFELVDVEMTSEHGRQILRLLLDKEGGITLDECARVSREVSPHLEVADRIPSRYTLEVSSPGIRRPLKRPVDFTRFKGQVIMVRTSEPIDPLSSRKKFRGVNLGLDEDGALILDAEEPREKINVALDLILEARLDPEIKV
ncbi:MAG: ribosome maturation factor RimP [Deltaproteobacteria bacterium]|nr:MAG: ribosome maturation factor RimP [Deltaproteobacteria bacterium]